MSSRKRPSPKPGNAAADRTIRRHVLELQATIQAALSAGWDGRPRAAPDPEILPTLDDHHTAIGVCPLPISRPHLRTRRAIEPVAAALCHLINRGSFHGSELAERCADATNAHRAITAAERVGLVERGIYQLSNLQTACGGMHYLPGGGWDAVNRKWIRPALGHHWITKTFKYLEVGDVEAIL